MTIDVTPDELKFITDSIAARGYLIREAMSDSADAAERAQFSAQLDRGGVLLHRLLAMEFISHRKQVPA